MFVSDNSYCSYQKVLPNMNKNIQHPAGIYYQAITSVELSNTHWHLFTYLNITNYNENFEK